MFNKEQLSTSLLATELLTPALWAAVIMDQEQLNSNIKSALSDDPIYKAHLNDPQTRWSVNSEGFLLHDNLVYVPDSNDLRLCILRFKHDHIISGHPGQTKTIELIRREYTWPGLHEFIKKYCTISFNSAGPMTRDGTAEILVSATFQTCRDMSKFSDIFSSFAPQTTIFFMMGTKYFQHQAKIAVMSVTIRRSEGGA
jgi:Integrase zinc binding domain